ncbi:MAG TPA: MipA/OmpV family protein [Burkholderiales bacterium]|nr:MipA/OmpV family protein [Burkholderiales bacterium]
MTARCVVLALLPIVPFAARAQSTLPDYAWIGAGARTRPAYDGSAAQRTDLIPTVRYYGKPWFARTTQGILEGGVRTELVQGLNLGAQLAYEGGRLASESDFLRSHNVPDINPSASVGLHLEWDQKLGPVPVTLLARGRHFVDSDRGAQADLRFTAIVFGGRAITAAVFVQGTWANSKSSQSFYGITPAQSTNLSPYAAGSGPLFATGGLLWGVDLSRQWIVVGNLEARRLHGDAARSPLAERTSNHYASASLAYRF